MSTASLGADRAGRLRGTTLRALPPPLDGPAAMHRYGIADRRCAERVAADFNALQSALAAAQRQAPDDRASPRPGGARRLSVVPNPAAGLMTTAEVATALRLSRRTVERRVAEGDLVPVRLGRAVRFDPAEVTRFLATCAPDHQPSLRLVPRGRALPPGERYW